LKRIIVDPFQDAITSTIKNVLLVFASPIAHRKTRAFKEKDQNPRSVTSLQE